MGLSSLFNIASFEFNGLYRYLVHFKNIYGITIGFCRENESI